MPLEQIDSLDDPRLDAFARLTEAQLRSRLEPERAILIAESEKVIDRALDAKMEPVSALMEEDRLKKSTRLIERLEAANAEVPVFVGERSVLEGLTGYELTRGALAAFKRPSLPPLEAILHGAHRIVVLEDITNHTNVGAIFRSAAALGIDGVLVTPGCYDPFYRRAARVSMGAVFQIPWTRVGSEGDLNGWREPVFAALQKQGFCTIAMALADEAVALGDTSLQGLDKVAIFMGTEGEGLAASTIEACDACVRIPMYHGVDSLNVAAASAVAFWELRVR